MPARAKVTPNERAVLGVLMRRRGAPRTGWANADQLVADPVLSSRTTQGVHQTAASLVRKGLARKGRDAMGLRAYALTEDGAAIALEEVTHITRPARR